MRSISEAQQTETMWRRPDRWVWRYKSK